MSTARKHFTKHQKKDIAKHTRTWSQAPENMLPGWPVGFGEVFASSLVVGSDPHFMNLFQDLSAVLNAKLVKKLFYVLRSFTLS